MEIILGIIIVFLLINTFLLIGIAGTLSRLVEVEAKPKSMTSVKSLDGLVDLPVRPTYDLAVLSGEVEPYTDGVERRLIPMKNWDGISSEP